MLSRDRLTARRAAGARRRAAPPPSRRSTGGIQRGLDMSGARTRGARPAISTGDSSAARTRRRDANMSPRWRRWSRASAWSCPTSHPIGTSF